MDVDGELEENVLIGEFGLLEDVRGKLALLVGSHERIGEFEGAETEGALGGAADVVHKSDDIAVLALVVILVLDEAEVDEVAHGGAGVPADIVGVNVNLLEVSYHLVLVVDIGLCARGGSGQTGSIVLVGIGASDIDSREREGVCNFKEAVVVHADERAGRSGREVGGAVLGNFHHHLEGEGREC